jgi:predicted dehydrogenase
MESRRDFLKKSGLGAAGAALGMTAKSYGNVVGANDRINVAFIGCGRRVSAFYDILKNKYNVSLKYVCDVKESQREKVRKEVKDVVSYSFKSVEDQRFVYEDQSVDAVFNATPDHWHAPGSWMAMDAGKHVYVEKPCSHNPHENERLVHFQKKYGKVVQMGNQQRSSPHTREIIQAIHEGAIGKPYKAVAFYSNNRGRVSVPVVASPPEDLNWDLFQGPAPREDYRHDTWNYNWHWYGWKWGTAETGNNSTHEFDIARWALQVEYPRNVFVESAKRHFPDDGWEMYDSMYATFTFPNGEVINWDGKSRNAMGTYGSGRGTIIYGTEGSVFVNRALYKLFDRAGALVRQVVSEGEEGGVALGGGGDMTTLHVENFLNSIRGTEKQRSPIDEGAKSTLLCHLANISSRLDKPLEINTANGHIYDREAMKLWRRDYAPEWSEAKNFI